MKEVTLERNKRDEKEMGELLKLELNIFMFLSF